MLSCFFLSDKKVYCEKLEDPENGDVKQKGIYKGAKAVYSCDEGYILTGKEIRVCQRNGKFSDEAPTCERKFSSVHALYMYCMYVHY